MICILKIKTQHHFKTSKPETVQKYGYTINTNTDKSNYAKGHKKNCLQRISRISHVKIVSYK